MQQVNLFTDDFRPRRTILPAWQIGALTAAIIVFGILYSVWLDYLTGNLERKNLALQTTVENLNTGIEDKQRALALRAKDTALQENVDALRRQLTNTDALQKALESGFGESAAATSFSNILTALARHRPKGIWLNRVRIAGAGTLLGIEGMTSEAETVPEYLRQLGEDAMFDGRSFNLFEIIEDSDRPQLSHFAVSTRDMENSGQTATQGGI